MASKDDQISDKRRRLFKALSAAPIVATLRPGEALASHSAYQCAAKIADPAQDPNLDPDNYSSSQLDGFLRKQFDFFVWPVSVANNCVEVLQNSSFPGTNVVAVPRDGVTTPASNADVDLYRYTPPPSMSMTPPALGTPITGDERLALVYDPTVAPSTLTLDKQGGGGGCQVLVASTGYFAVLFDSDSLTAVTTYPIPATSSAQLQGMTHTCLCSFDSHNPVCLNSG
jgi:hypothetical protein